MPRTLVLAEAPQAEVNHQVREELEGRGALLDERTRARTVFEGIATAGGLKRGGYVGVYQPLGDKGAEVYLQGWATAARRAWWITVGVQFAIVLLMFATSPPSAAWYNAALVLWPWLGAAGLLYYLTFRGSRELEDDLAAALATRFAAKGWALVTEEQQLEQRVRERLEGERARRDLAAREAARPKPAKPERGRKPGLFGPKPTKQK